MDLTENFQRVRENITEAARRSGRHPEEITLIAVSKTQPPEAVQAAIDCGQRVFGENRVQEGVAKARLLPGNLEWHLIGHLQKNKVKHALGMFHVVHGVDSLELAQAIDRLAAERGLFPKVMLEINLAQESTKHGFTPENLKGELEDVLSLERLQITGLMCIPPIVPKAELARPYFAKLRALRDDLAVSFKFPLPDLSMGMSGDYAVAIEEGATHVRVGTALFGERKGVTWRPEMPVED
jgi:pyridoxal phosphate enzyme (YggS family)